MDIFLNLVNGETIEQSVMADVCVIGRSSKCDVVVPHEGMSRMHCQIEVENGEIFVTDLGSTNGVMIDGQKIEPHTKTHYQTYLTLSFGAVQSLQVEIEGGKIGVDQSQTDHTTQRQSNFTRTVTRTLQDKTKPDALSNSRNKKAPVKDNKAQMWTINILALIILGGAVYWYIQSESTEDAVLIEPTLQQQKRAEENFDRF